MAKNFFLTRQTLFIDFIASSFVLGDLVTSQFATNSTSFAVTFTKNNRFRLFVDDFAGVCWLFVFASSAVENEFYVVNKEKRAKSVKKTVTRCQC